MDLSDKLSQFSKRVEMLRGNLLNNEEATKTALIMPFFQLLGYDVFNPVEFIPEFTADFGIKKGEKVDYAIKKDGKLSILIECKAVNDDLSKHEAQLYRYFSVTESKFAILTNGVIYKFFTDLEEENKMDNTPFLEVNIQDLSDMEILEIKKFTKDKFDIDNIFNTASELKYTKVITSLLNSQMNNPTDDFVRFVIGSFYDGVKTQNVVEKFRPIVKKSLQTFVSNYMNDKLKLVLNNNLDEIEKDDSVNEFKENDVFEVKEVVTNNIETTEEELEAFQIVKEILSEVVEDEEDITYKDVERYFNVLYKKNTRKWICRFYFNGKKKYIKITDQNKEITTHDVENISDIYKYKELLLTSVSKYI